MKAWAVFGLCALGIAGCGRRSGSSNTVTVQLDVTSPGPAVEWSGSIVGENSVSVNGTTPSSQQVRIRANNTASCTSFPSCPGSTSIIANIFSFGRGVGDTVTAPVLTVCLKDLDNGNRDCQTGAGAVRVSVES